MCGIYGHLRTSGNSNSATICINGLKRLEYRGYDSAGIAGVSKNKIVSFKSVGKVELLDAKVKSNQLELEMAIAHTRWATHGCLTNENAHPHYDESQSLALVHNGIIENYRTIKNELLKKGVRFVSETDTEVISHLIALH